MSTQIWPTSGGPKHWELSRDAEGHREYKIRFQVKADSIYVGPFEVLETSGLPQPGEQWAIGNDADEFAWCLPTATAKPRLSGEANDIWDTEHIFSTKPPSAGKQRCNDHPIEDPLLEPQKISGSFAKDKWEAVYQRTGIPITNSSWEQIRGPQVEFEISKASVKIEQNVPALQMPLLATMGNTVNAFSLWGFGPRHIKLSNISYERKYFGQCFVYFTRTLEFEMDTGALGFDRDILDEGTKVLNGHWNPTTGAWDLDNIAGAAPDPKNPKHFIRFKDKNGENSRVVLNGAGRPAGSVTTTGNNYVCIVASSLNSSPPSANWHIITSAEVSLWDGSVTYVSGDMVTTADGRYWVALSTNTTKFPDTGSAFWELLGTNGITDQGVWDATTTYTLGDLVAGTTSTSAGKIHVEFYDESDFLLLGIPTDLESATA